jgi:hypothetical protein
MIIEIYLEDVCSDRARKHVYNCKRKFKAADHILYVLVGGRTTCALCSVYGREYSTKYVHILCGVQDEKKQEWQKSPTLGPGKQTAKIRFGLDK